MMFTKVLTDEQVKKFTDETGIKATSMLLHKNRKYYYVTIIDESIKLRISKELANKIFQNSTTS